MNKSFALKPKTPKVDGKSKKVDQEKLDIMYDMFRATYRVIDEDGSEWEMPKYKRHDIMEATGMTYNAVLHWENRYVRDMMEINS